MLAGNKRWVYESRFIKSSSNCCCCWKQVVDERDEGQPKQNIYGPSNQNKELKEAKTLHIAMWNYSFFLLAAPLVFVLPIVGSDLEMDRCFNVGINLATPAYCSRCFGELSKS